MNEAKRRKEGWKGEKGLNYRRRRDGQVYTSDNQGKGVAPCHDEWGQQWAEKLRKTDLLREGRDVT